MHDDNDKYLSALVGFGLGALVGAGLALLLAPKTGSETRDLLSGYLGQARDEIYTRGREAKATLDSVIERGKAAYEGGKTRVGDAYDAAKKPNRTPDSPRNM
jgi:gas vesicle protein